MCRKLSVALIVAFLTACSTTTYVRELPPPELLADCPTVREAFKTNGELAETIIAYRDALTKCNLDKESLREWANLSYSDF